MSYLNGHRASGLKVGDQVRITRVAHSREAGWEDAWVPRMTNMMEAGTATITHDGATHGFRLDGRFNFPFFVLEKVHPLEQQVEELTEEVKKLRKQVKKLRKQVEKQTPKTLYDWESVPGWVMYIAKDKNGKIYGYSEQPTPRETVWGMWGTYSLLWRDWSDEIYWKHSLEKRPGT